MIFLIYGVSVTEYQYNTNGQIEAQKLSVSDIRKQKKYEHVLSSYLACRALYEKTLMLDYRLGAGEEEPMVIAPEYEALLTDVEDLSVKTDALQVDAKYEQIKSMLLTWIKDDIAVYLQICRQRFPRMMRKLRITHCKTKTGYMKIFPLSHRIW